MKKNHIPILLCLLHFASHARELITRNVSDVIDYHVLVCATVARKHSGKLVVADIRGKFAFTAPLPETLLSFVGFSSCRQFISSLLKQELHVALTAATSFFGLLRVVHRWITACLPSVSFLETLFTVQYGLSPP